MRLPARRCWLTLVAALAVTAGACADDDPTVTPTVDPDAGAPGTEIADGLQVVAGSRLLGRAFPNVEAFAVVDGDDDEPDGWVAYLEVSGEPVAVFTGYLDQLDALGYAVVADGSGDGSGDFDDPGGSEDGGALCAGSDDEDFGASVSCAARLTDGEHLVAITLDRRERSGGMEIVRRAAEGDSLEAGEEPVVAPTDLPELAPLAEQGPARDAPPGSAFVGSVIVDDGEGGDAFNSVYLVGTDRASAEAGMRALRDAEVDSLDTDAADTEVSDVVTRTVGGQTLVAWNANNPASGFTQALAVVPDGGGPVYALVYAEDAG